uniref:Uncharacterized protein n=1 Tax=Strigamia maritima TaxID=126957 RepID=T1JG09_STRMM
MTSSEKRVFVNLNLLLSLSKKAPSTALKTRNWMKASATYREIPENEACDDRIERRIGYALESKPRAVLMPRLPPKAILARLPSTAMSCHAWIRCLLTLILVVTTSAISWNNTSDALEILDGLLKTHDRRATPTHNLESLKVQSAKTVFSIGIPTTVSIEMFLRSFGSINPETMDYEVDLYLRQSWVDERLNLVNLTHELDLNDPKLVQMIWKPEVFFPNAKEAAFQIVTVPNLLLRINPGGNILYMLRLKLTFSCMMDLAKYPLDRQVCSIELSSFTKTTRELLLTWSPEKPVKIIDGLKLPQFELQQIVPTDCIETFSIGEYSCLRAKFVLERSVGYHLVQSYLPTTLIVIISWVSFWLDIDAIPARVTLGVTTLLTISSESTGIRSNLPPVSYVKALDVWMGTCTTFVFAALIEFTVVNYLFRRKELNSTRNNDDHRNSSLAETTAHMHKKRLVVSASELASNIALTTLLFPVKKCPIMRYDVNPA